MRLSQFFEGIHICILLFHLMVYVVTFKFLIIHGQIYLEKHAGTFAGPYWEESRSYSSEVMDVFH